MIIVDTALRRREAEAGNPVRVGMVGAGFMARGIAQLDPQLDPRDAPRGHREPHRRRPPIRAYTEAGVDAADVAEPTPPRPRGRHPRRTATPSPTTRCCVAERRWHRRHARGDRHGRVRRRTSCCGPSQHGKHVVSMNAELDGTVGPILKARADAAGVILTACDGDQPGVEMNLLPVRRGHRPAAARLRQHQGPPGPVPQPDDPGGVRGDAGA